MNQTLETLQHTIQLSLCTTVGTLTYAEITQHIIDLAILIVETDTDERTWSIGEHTEAPLDALIIGAFWHYTDWHDGQDSLGYAALSALGTVFFPGMASGPEDDTAECDVYNMLNEMAEAANNV